MITQRYLQKPRRRRSPIRPWSTRRRVAVAAATGVRMGDALEWFAACRRKPEGKRFSAGHESLSGLLNFNHTRSANTKEQS